MSNEQRITSILYDDDDDDNDDDEKDLYRVQHATTDSARGSIG